MSQIIEITLSEDQLEGTAATLSQWLFNEGDQVQEGEPILELETDKVSMEICAPKTGIIQQILLQAGEPVVIGAVLGTLSEAADVIKEAKSDTFADQNSLNRKVQLENNNVAINQQLISPAVRRLLRENNLNIDNIKGTGRDGRVNRNDVRRYLAKSDNQAKPQSTLVPHSTMRKTIAKHMVESLLEISPHVTSVFEMNMSNVIEHRKWHKKEYQQQAVNLTYTAYFLAAIVKAVQQAPEVNARFHADALEIFSDINIGVGTALGAKGLVVPVVQQVQNLSLFEIAAALTEQTTKARNGTLKPSDMKNGTFTISNHGVSGSLFAAPIIINQPEVAILGIGKLEKRVVVEEINQQDTMQIRPMCYVSLSIDHRALDAYQTSQFLQAFVQAIENWGN